MKKSLKKKKLLVIICKEFSLVNKSKLNSYCYKLLEHIVKSIKNKSYVKHSNK